MNEEPHPDNGLHNGHHTGDPNGHTNGRHAEHDSAPLRLPARQAAVESEEEAHATPPWVKLHAMLRGRYKWAVPLAGLLALLGAAGGWYVTQPVYTSRGVIQIKPRVDPILYKTDASSVMPMFDSFVATQTQLMSSPRVLDMAMSNPAWRRVGVADTPTTSEGYARSLSVDRQRGSNLIHVRYTHEKPDVAQVAVNTAIDAYMQLYGEQDVASENKRLTVLTQRRDRLSSQLSELQQQIRGMADEYATDSLEEHYRFKLQSLQDIEAALRETQLALTAAGVELENGDVDAGASAAGPGEPGSTPGEAASGPGGQSEGDAPSIPNNLESYEAAAAQDPVVRQALQSWRRAQRRLESISRDFGKSHRAYEPAQDALEAAKESLELAMASYRTRVAAGAVDGGGGPPNLARLRSQYQELLQLHAQVKAETLAIGRKNLQIKSLKRDAEDMRQKLEETKFAIEKINVERAAAGRVEVISEARTPSSPANASNRKQLVVLGFGGGGTAGFALVLGLALLDRRVRYSDDVLPSRPAAGDLRALGLLPQLPPHLETREQSQSTAYAVHHIRTMLQVGYRGGPVTAITGPASGSGKTSLTIALGLSYASTGSKTLLIDADFIGAGLTHRMEGFRRERLGEILLRTRLIDESQLQRAIDHAQRENLRLGEALIDLEVLTEADIDKGLSLQRESCPGLLEALRGGSVENSFAETGVENLHILPLLNASASQVAAANPEAVERVLREVARHYQHVLIDLGPVPGSVEAAVLAAAANRTVLVVSRGDSKPMYDRCVEFMRSLGTPLAGVVFNRAGEYDVQQSAAMSTSTSRSVSRSQPAGRGQGRSQPGGHNGVANGDRFGPLGAGVASQDADER